MIKKIVFKTDFSNGHSYADLVDIDFNSKTTAEIAAKILKSVGLNVAWENQNLPKNRVCIMLSSCKKEENKDKQLNNIVRTYRFDKKNAA